MPLAGILTSLVLTACVAGGQPQAGAATATGIGPTESPALLSAAVEPIPTVGESTPSLVASSGAQPSESSVEDVAPDSSRGKPWAAYGPTGLIVGLVGDRRRWSFPADRRYLSLANGIVATAGTNPDGKFTFVYLSDWTTGGDVLPPVLVQNQVVAGIAANGRLYVSGFGSASEAPSVVALSFIDGSTQALVSTKDLDPEGQSSRNLLVSASARTILSAVCVPEGCSGGDVIDANSATAVRHLDLAGGASAISDDAVLVRFGEHVTSEIALLDIETGKELWRIKGSEFYGAYITASDEVVVLRSGEGAPTLDVIERGGAVRLSVTLKGLTNLWTELSSDDFAIVGRGGLFPGDAGGDGRASAAVIDLRSGVISPAGFVIDLDGRP